MDPRGFHTIPRRSHSTVHGTVAIHGDPWSLGVESIGQVRRIHALCVDSSLMAGCHGHQHAMRQRWHARACCAASRLDGQLHCCNRNFGPSLHCGGDKASEDFVAAGRRGAKDKRGSRESPLADGQCRFGLGLAPDKPRSPPFPTTNRLPVHLPCHSAPVPIMTASHSARDASGRGAEAHEPNPALADSPAPAPAAAPVATKPRGDPQ